MTGNAYTRLLEKGVRPSPQRMAILAYLLTHRTHPTADEIFSALSPDLPTLSRTTVYNTLKLLTAKGAVLCLDIDPKNAHYDGDISRHGHFLCKGCGCIRDISLKDRDFPILACPEDLRVTEALLYLKGYCASCDPRKGKEADPSNADKKTTL